ncbi:tail fiber protein [Rodentibacter pneumotropicus]|nr:tail fiber protein [Rodentibacter pneumotropicus]THA03674.1 hypothetical protein D3M72_03045 [Rodentibacter pneumotropicus]
MKTLLPEINSADKRFHNGNPATGEQGTRVTDTWLNDVQDRVRDVQAEAHYVLQKAGFTPKAETQTQLYQAIVKIIEDNRNSAGIAEKGEVQLTNDYSGDSEVLGLTQKAGKALKALIDSLTRNLSNYIPNSKKSNVVNSSSSDTIATSAAAKTAYDKGVEAKNAADNAQRTADEAVRFNRNYFAGDLNTLNDKHEICYLEQAQTKNRNFPADAYQWGVLHVYSNGTLGSQVYYADNGELWARTRWHSHNWNEWKRLDGLDIPTTRASKRALSTDDLNNISASGIYGQNANINATPARHYPIQQAGMLLVTEHSGYGAQQLYAPFNAGYLYARGRNANNGWDNWKRIDGLDKVLKSGDTMTGNLTINHGEPRVHGNRNNSNNWYVGLPNGSSNDLNLHSYAHNTSLILLSDRVKATKPLYVGSERVALLGDFTNPVFTLTNNANSSGSLNNISGTKFLSFGDGALNGLGLPGGADWVGIQIADQSGQKTQIISAGLNNHYIRTNDDLSKNIWYSEKLLTDKDFTYQKIGNFEIRRYPDGTMIQTYFIEFNDIFGTNSGLGGYGQKQLTWATSFIGKPIVFGSITTSLEDYHDAGVNILTKSTNTTLYWYNYEHGHPNQGLSRLQFLAIGRWK